MLDPVKTALAALGTAFTAGAAWVNLKGRITQTKRDLNGLGSRVSARERAEAEMVGHIDELRQHIDDRHERMLERDAQLRERLSAVETRLEMIRDEKSRTD